MFNRSQVQLPSLQPILAAGYRCVVHALLIFITLVSLISCHSSRKVHSRPGKPAIELVHIGKLSKTQKELIKEAETWLGTPYKYAAQEKGRGTDCSGLVLMVFDKVLDEKLPRNSAKQAEYCQPLDASEVDCGDLIFFATGKDPERISHVGIVIDERTFIHASASKGVVVSDYTTPYYQRKFRMFGRVHKMKH